MIFYTNFYLLYTAGAMSQGGGAQVYIDAGQKIDTERVRRLLKECLRERLRSILNARVTVGRVPADAALPDFIPATQITGLQPADGQHNIPHEQVC